MKNNLFWDFYALGYDALNLSLPHHEINKKIKEYAISDQKLTILDAGCGTGSLLLDISKLSKNIYIGIDFSSLMILIAKIKQLFSKRKNIKFIKQSIVHKLPFESKSVDMIILVNVLFSLDNLNEVLAELYKILKKDGKILIITPRKNYNYLFVIKKHFSELSKLSIIRKIYILLLTLLALPAFIIITISNIIISGREKNGGYSQYSKNDIYNLLDMTNFSDIVINQIVAGQEWFVSATK